MASPTPVGGAYDFAAFETVVDVGSGHGVLLNTILQAHEGVNGIVFDTPHVVAGAGWRLTRVLPTRSPTRIVTRGSTGGGSCWCPPPDFRISPRIVASLAVRDFAQKTLCCTSEQTSFSVGALALANELRAALRASVRRHRRAQGGSPMLRSIRPKRATSRGT